MKWPHLPQDDRLLDLLADQATEGLDSEKQRELDALLDDYPGIPEDCLELTAATVDLTFASNDQEELPADLRKRLLADAREWAEQSQEEAESDDDSPERASSPLGGAPAQFNWFGGLGWLAAAACLAIMIVPTLIPPPTEAELRDELVRTAPDVVVIQMKSLKEPGFEQVSGEVVWSESRQEGYMTLRGFPPTTESEHYQLWIVDPQRDKTPVDGGVFELASRTETVVRIAATLRCEDAQQFVLTREKSGGVVVSDGPHLAAARR